MLSREAAQDAVFSTDDRVGEVAFGLLQFQNAFFDRVFCDKPVSEDMARLADPVRSVDGLAFYSGIPPGIEEKDIIGCCQVQAKPSGFEADQEQRALRVRLESLNLCGSVARFSIEVFVDETLPVEGFPHNP